MASSHAVELMTAEELRRGKPWLNLMKPNRKKRPDGQHSEPHTIRNRRHIGAARTRRIGRNWLIVGAIVILVR